MDVKVLELKGEPRERGLKIGNTLKPLIENSIEILLASIEDALEIKKLKKILIRVIKGSKLKEAVQKWTPSLWEEFKAVADSTEIDINLLFALQCQDEIGVFLESMGIDLGSHCSTFGCSKTELIPTIVAQNYDWQRYQHEEDVVILKVKYPNSSFETIIPTFLGLKYLCGINNQSIAVCVNAICAYLNYSFAGLPVPYVTRGLVEQPTLEKAVEFLHSIVHASGYAYTIGDSKNVMNFECSTNKIHRYLPVKDLKRVYHTNHPLATDDLLPERRTPEPKDSYDRYDFLDSNLRDPSAIIDIDTTKKFLSTPPVCVHGNDNAFSDYTIISVINELKSNPALYLTLGPPCSNEYHKFQL